MKKSLTFLATLAVFLGFAGFASAVVLNNPLGNQDFAGLICKVVVYIGGLVASLSVVMFVWAGTLYVLSAGDPAKIQKAKDVLKYAVYGTALALAGGGLIGLIANVIGASSGPGCGS